MIGVASVGGITTARPPSNTDRVRVVGVIAMCEHLCTASENSGTVRARLSGGSGLIPRVRRTATVSWLRLRLSETGFARGSVRVWFGPWLVVGWFLRNQGGACTHAGRPCQRHRVQRA